MDRRSRPLVAALTAIATLAALALLTSRARDGAPLRVGETDLEVFDVAALELAAAAGLDAPTAASPRDGVPAARTPLAAATPRVPLALAGRVSALGAPLEGAAVHLELLVDGGRAGRVVRVRRPARTGRDGRFEILGRVPRARAAVLEVRHPDFAPVVRTVVLVGADAATEVPEVVLTRGGGVTGVVTDLAGVPLAGATVTIRPTDGNPLGRASRWRTLLAPGTTDAAGRYTFERLPAGAYAITATAAGRQPRALAEPARVAEGGAPTAVPPLRLDAGRALRVTVADPDGAPRAGAQVRVHEAPGADAEPPVRVARRTDADGRVRFDHLPPRRLALTVTADGFCTARAEVPADDRAESAVDVRLAPGLGVAGTVVDAARGTPVTRYAVAVCAADPSLEAVDGDAPERAPTDLGAPADHPDGTFRIDGLDAGTWRVEVAAPGVGSARSDPFELRPGSGTRTVTLVIRPGRTVTGVVVAARDGSPLGDVRVAVRPAGEAEPVVVALDAAAPAGTAAVATAVTAADGTFRLEHAPAGAAVVRAEHGGFVAAEAAIDGGGAGLRIELAEPAVLTGTVAGATPRSVVLAYAGPGALHRVRVADDGRYRIDGLAPGGYVVRASDDDPRDVLLGAVRAACDASGRPRDVDVVLAAGAEHELPLEVRELPFGALRGTVVENGAPATGRTVRLVPAGLAAAAPRFVGRRIAGTVGIDGTFVLERVPAGRYELVVAGDRTGRDALHRETVVVQPRAALDVAITLVTGTLDVVATTPDGGRPSGHVRLRAGVTQATAHLATGDAPVLHAPLHDGRAVLGPAPAGPALLVVDVPGRTPVTTDVVVPSGGTRATVTVELGPSRGGG